MDKRCIVAMGGGGFSMEPENLALDRYVLGLTGKPKARVCFVSTASGDSASYIEGFYAAFGTLPSEPSHLSLFDWNIPDPRAHILSQDVIYVGGGNTFNMLSLWRAHGVDKILEDAWNEGVVLCGLSAGSLCWYEAGITDSFGLPYKALHDGLGFLPGSHCPHYDGEMERQILYDGMVGDGTLPPGVAVDDGAALRYQGTELVEAVASGPGRHAWHVRRGPDGVESEVIPGRLLVD